MTFGEAVELTRQGKLITRKSWDYKNVFVFIRPGDNIKVETALNFIKTLPQSVRDYFKKENEKQENSSQASIWFAPHFCMKLSGNVIVNGWCPTQNDLLADDWEEFTI